MLVSSVVFETEFGAGGRGWELVTSGQAMGVAVAMLLAKVRLRVVVKREVSRIVAVFSLAWCCCLDCFVL